MLRSGGFVLIFLFFVTIRGHGQEHCNCVVDTNRILLNTDLDYFLFKLKSETFTAFKQTEYVPKFVMDQLDCVAHGFSLANPNQDYRCCCTSPKKLPKRKLLYLARSSDILVMTYLTGGIAVETHLLMIEFSGGKIEKLWTGFGAGNLKSPQGIASFIKRERNQAFGLNTNIVTL